MPQFKVRDLMINVIPEGGRGQGACFRGVTLPNCAGDTCLGVSYLACAVSCPDVTFCRVTLVGGICPNLSAACPAATCGKCTEGDTCNMCTRSSTYQGGYADLQLQDLAILKQQLKQSLTQVEAQERALEEGLRPQTLDEVQQLEEKLTAALTELKARRAELERATPKTKG